MYTIHRERTASGTNTVAKWTGTRAPSAAVTKLLVVEAIPSKETTTGQRQISTIVRYLSMSSIGIIWRRRRGRGYGKGEACRLQV